ncbi:hypothetical protein C8J57DRAFT_1519550 [Mycena rebaudengoi]|nr:hypothetical protein C8J57DRAFT_1519550 [Mycena rebaudengoi]
MNDPQLFTFNVMDALRHRVYNWLRTIHQGFQAHTLVTPFPNLPQDFPFGDFTMSPTFEWQDNLQYYHRYTVAFKFDGITNGPGSSVAWTISTSVLGVHQVLSVFEIPGRIYCAQNVPIPIDADLVLKGMLASLGERAPVYLEITYPNC